MAITKATASSIAPAAKGDLVVGSATNDAAVLAVGTNDYVLTADSSATNGVKWAAAAGGGKVLQVVGATITTDTTITSTTLTDTNITATITPTLSTSKILILISANTAILRSDTEIFAGAKLLRGSTGIVDFGASYFMAINAEPLGTGKQTRSIGQNSIVYLDSPATTSATTYKLQAKVDTATLSANIRFQAAGAPSNIILMEIGA